MKKIFRVILVIIIMAAGAWWFITWRNSSAPVEHSEPVEHTVELGSIVQTVESSGVVAANLEVEIKCKASGEVINLPCDISDTVAEGDLLVELDPVDELRNVEIAQVSLQQSRANLEKAGRNLMIAENDLATARERAELDLETARLRADDERSKAERIRELFENGFAGEEENESAETAAQTAEAAVEQALIALEDLNSDEAALELRRQDVLLAEANMESARISLSIANQRLDDTKVYAPMDGVVTERQVQIGQIISSGISNTGGGTTTMVISDLTRIFVLAAVDESDIGRISPDQRVTITADAYPGMVFDGSVQRIAQKGTNVSNVVTFEVKIEVNSAMKHLLMPEMTANVEIIIVDKSDVITVPVNAVSRGEDGHYVTVKLADGGTESRLVEVGINNGALIEITGGLSEGEIILIDESSAFSQWRNDGSSGGRPAGGLGGTRPH